MRPYFVRNLTTNCTRSLLQPKKSDNSLLSQRKSGAGKPLSLSVQNNARLQSTTAAAASTLPDLIVQSPHPPIRCIDGLTIPELVWHNLPIKENEIAIECSITGQTLTHGQVYKQSRNLAGALLKLGLKRQECVSVVLPNIIHFPTIMLGILEAGGICSTANPAYTSEEIVRQVKMSESKIAITIPSHLPAVRQALKECPHLKSIIVVGEAHEGCHTYSEMVKADSAGIQFLRGSEINSKDFVAFLPFSSGTTGPPKGVELTHHNICSNLEQYTSPNCANITKLEQGNGQDRLVGVLPFFHVYGLTSIALTSSFCGNRILCIPKFTSDTFVKNLRHTKPTLLTLVPPIIAFLVHNPDVTAKDFEQVRTVQVGAAPMGVTLINKLFEKAGKELFLQEMYGLTETSPGTNVLDKKFKRTKVGSCGNLLPNTLGKVIDPDTGKGLGPGQRGELCLKGPQVMKGYFRNPEATAHCIDSDNWFHTGDIAKYDEDGCFYIVDRLKELIKVKGLQVAPAELEDMLRKHPGVGDCAVIGIPDERSGELPRAYIVPKTKNVTASEIHSFLDGKVSKHKELKGGVEFLDVIPKAPSGKILRRELRQNYTSKFGKA